MSADARSPAEPRWLDDAEHRAWMALLEIGSGLFDVISTELKAFAGITLEDYEVLHLLSQAESRRMRTGELADTMLASRTRLTQRIDRLVERGWIERVPCPDDRRAIWVVLTDDGFEFLASIAPRHLEHVRTHVFDHLSGRDVEHLGTSLTKIADHLHAERGAPT